MIIKKLLCSMSLALWPVVSFAEDSASEIKSADIESCVAYFAQGGLEQWIGGGAVVAISLVGLFTRWNVPSSVKAIARWAVDRQKGSQG